MHFSEVLVFVASFLHIAAFIIYNKQLLAGKNTPNIATWSIWAFESLVGLSSYQIMSGDYIKSVIPAISSILCITTFFISLCKGRFVKTNKFDLIALCLGIAAVMAWWYFKSATCANMLVQLCIAIGFVPTIRSVWKNPRNEKFSPWFLWSFAYTIGTVAVLMRWNNQYQDLVYYVDCIFLHFAVAVLALRRTTKTGHWVKPKKNKIKIV